MTSSNTTLLKKAFIIFHAPCNIMCVPSSHQMNYHRHFTRCITITQQIKCTMSMCPAAASPTRCTMNMCSYLLPDVPWTCVPISYQMYHDHVSPSNTRWAMNMCPASYTTGIPLTCVPITYQMYREHVSPSHTRCTMNMCPASPTRCTMNMCPATHTKFTMNMCLTSQTRMMYHKHMSCIIHQMYHEHVLLTSRASCTINMFLSSHTRCTMNMCPHLIQDVPWTCVPISYQMYHKHLSCITCQMYHEHVSCISYQMYHEHVSPSHTKWAMNMCPASYTTGIPWTCVPIQCSTNKAVLWTAACNFWAGPATFWSGTSNFKIVFLYF